MSDTRERKGVQHNDDGTSSCVLRKRNAGDAVLRRAKYEPRDSETEGRRRVGEGGDILLFRNRKMRRITVSI